MPFTQEKLRLYLETLEQETDNYLERYPQLRQADTIYFGGGTPSLLNGRQLNALTHRFSHEPQAEISLEVNPLQITRAYLEDLRGSEVNRLSLGLQSLLDDELVWLERRHRAEQIPAKIGMLREYGFENYSLDLIYGLPGATLKDLEYNLDRYLELEPKHISSYLLTLEHQDVQDAPETEDLQAEMYELICFRLIAAGYEQYEISNFCLPGWESRHNLHYWQSDDYLGLGASATGYLGGQRYQNPADMQEYRENVRQKRLIPDPEVGNRQADDYLIMGLRLHQGIDLAVYSSRFGKDLAKEKYMEIEKLREMELLCLEDNRLKLTRKALFISNAVIGELIT